ncbi:MAG: hypothetical protein R6V19_13280 [Armatimonadota bacterium]
MNDRQMEEKLRRVDLLPPPPQAKARLMQEATRRATINRRLRIVTLSLAAAAIVLFIFNFAVMDIIENRLDALASGSSISARECADALKARQKLIVETLEFNPNGNYRDTESTDEADRAGGADMPEQSEPSPDSGLLHRDRARPEGSPPPGAD